MSLSYLWLLFFFLCYSSAQIVTKYYQGLEIPEIPPGKPIEIEEQYFEQKVDHFHVSDQRTWFQRYWENKTNYEPGGPVFLLLSGEAPATTYWMNSGSWHIYAQDVNAMMFMIEHRYYGESRPVKDTSVENLEYLSAEQAMEDAAFFINAMNKKYNYTDETKWIVFGGSYAGSLATWFRMKYPHLVYAAVASSAPLVATHDFTGFFHAIAKIIATYSPKCEKHISRAYKELEVMSRTEHGRFLITKWLKLCDNLTENVNDIALVHQNLGNQLANLVQNDKSYKGATGLSSIPGICDFMTNDTVWKNKTTSVRRFIELHKILFNLTEGENCLPSKYDSYFDILKQTDWDISSLYGKQWMYQTCTQFGFFQSSSKRGDTFGRLLPIEYFIKNCQDVFGSRFNMSLQKGAVDRTNLIYGGLYEKLVRVVHIHGSADPWHPLGLYSHELYGGRRSEEIIYIKGATHCSDMFEPSDKDSEDLKSARERIRNKVHLWIIDS